MMSEKYGSAFKICREVAEYFRPPRRMPVSDAVRKFMRVPHGANSSIPWDSSLTPYINEPLNTLAKREYDAVIFAGPARTGKTLGLIDGWIVYGIVCDPA
ncbi:TPA: phage terminase large subunit family protein, partial [Salmonella enterica]